MNQPSISYIIASRNDDYCDRPMDRLYNTVEQISEVHEEPEIIIVDWGATELWKELVLRDNHFVINVPTSITNQIPTPFSEVHALNAGIRRATGRWIARLDQDILVQPRFVEWFDNDVERYDSVRTHLGSGGGMRIDPAFFSSRSELPKDWNGRDPAKQYRLPFKNEPFYTSAVGIVLAPATAWQALRGYNESLIHRNYMENELCVRFENYCGIHDIGPMLNYPFWHQWHVDVDRKLNHRHSIDTLRKLYGKQFTANGENWGLGNLELEMI